MFTIIHYLACSEMQGFFKFLLPSALLHFMCKNMKIDTFTTPYAQHADVVTNLPLENNKSDLTLCYLRVTPNTLMITNKNKHSAYKTAYLI